MTARTDLDHAFSILDAGITAHVAALQASKVSEAAAKASALSDTFIAETTAKVLAFADTLEASNPAPVVAVVPAAVVMQPPAAPLTPVVQQAAQVAQVLPVAPVVAPAQLVLPESVAHDPGATPAMIAAAIAATQPKVPTAALAAPVAPTSGTFAKLEAALQGLVPKP
jgi:hypothetical protein